VSAALTTARSGERSIAGRSSTPPRAPSRSLRGLPFELRSSSPWQRVRLVHGSLRKINEYLFEDKPARTFERIAGLSDCDVLVFGHTEQPWIHEYGGVLFVNCGSVGKPKHGDPRCALGRARARRRRESRPQSSGWPTRPRRSPGGVAEAGLPVEYGEKLLIAA
jgi:diadenosine tetraphosphatase ApaH/serine/threonine PP2A family protein phosphatase